MSNINKEEQSAKRVTDSMTSNEPGPSGLMVQADRDYTGRDAYNAETMFIAHHHPAGSSNSTEQAKMDSLQQDREKLKKFLGNKLKQNCWHEAHQFVRRRVNYVPLELTRIIDKNDDIIKKEVQQMRYKQPSGDLNLENLFLESRKSAENSLKFNPSPSIPDDTKSNRLDVLSNVVAVIGSAGMGKSFLCKKMLQLIDNKKIKTEFIFYLKFRDIDYKRRTNLLTFLTGKAEYEEYDEERIQNLVNCISESQNVYLICDGFDESKLSISGTNNTVNIHNSRAENFIIGLLGGEILPKSKKLITSRPRSLWELPEKYQPHFIVQILGISKDSQKQLCNDVCGEIVSDKIFEHVQRYVKLSFYCHIPLFSTLIFHILSCNHDKSNLPTSLTEIFLVLIILYTSDKSVSRGEVPLKELCSLALHGILNGKIFFDHDDMKAFGLEKSDQNDFTVTIQCQDTKNAISLFTNATVQYTYFGHLSIQEVFAALGIVLFENVERCEELLFAADRKIDLLRTDYDVFALCIVGLCNEVTYSKYFHNIPVKFNHDLYKQKVDLIKRFIENIKLTFNGRYSFLTYDDSYLRQSSYKIFEFLYELNDVTMTRQFANNLKNRIRINVGGGHLLPNHVLPLNNLLCHRSKEIKLDVKCFDDAGIRFFTELGVTLEGNPNVKLMRLSLYFMQITDEILEASRKCFEKVLKEIKVVHGIYVFPGIYVGFTSNNDALKFVSIINQRKTKLKKLICNVSRVHDHFTQILRGCQQNVENEIDIRRYDESEEEYNSSLSEISFEVEDWTELKSYSN